MTELLRELVVAVRQLKRCRGALVSLTLGIGLSVGAGLVIFAQIYDVLAGFGRFDDPARLVVIENPAGYTADGSGAGTPYGRRLSRPDFDELLRQHRMFSAVGGFNSDYVAIMTGGDRPRTVCRIFVTPRTLDVLGVRPVVGRQIVDADFAPNAGGVAFLTESMWRSYFAGDTSVIGRSIQVDEQPFVVAGVMPREAAAILRPRRRLFDAKPNDRCLITPLVSGLAGEATGVIEFLRGRPNDPWIVPIGRVRSDVPPENAEAELSLIGSRLWQQNPGRSQGFTLRAVRFRTWQTASIRPLLVMLIVAAVLTLLVTCANAVGLLLAESLRRAPEFGVRIALGATPRHLLRVVLIRAVLWCLPGGALGLVLSTIANGVFTPDATLMNAAAIDDTHLLAASFAAGAVLTLIVALTSGTATAWILRRQDLGRMLRDGTQAMAGHSRQRPAMLLLTVQIGAAVALAMGAGLLLRSIWYLNTSDYGFELQHGFVMEVRLPRSRFARMAEQLAFYDSALARIRALPGVVAAGFSSSPPLANASASISGDVELRTGTVVRTIGRLDAQFVSSGYFEALGVRLVRGRLFTESDDRRSTVVVDEAFQRRFLDRGDPLTSELRFAREALPIVGVVQDTRQSIDVGRVASMGSERAGLAYLPLAKFTSAPTWRFLVLRSPLHVAAVADLVTRELLSINPSVVLGDPIAFQDLLREKTAESRRLAALLGSVACIVLILTGASITSALSHLIALRSREIAIRYCLGARRGQIACLAARHLGVPLGAGVSVGVVAGLLIGRGLVNQLYGVTPADARALGAALACLACISVTAAAGPLLRAFRINPADTTRGL